MRSSNVVSEPANNIGRNIYLIGVFGMIPILVLIAYLGQLRQLAPTDWIVWLTAAIVIGFNPYLPEQNQSTWFGITGLMLSVVWFALGAGAAAAAIVVGVLIGGMILGFFRHRAWQDTLKIVLMQSALAGILLVTLIILRLLVPVSANVVDAGTALWIVVFIMTLIGSGATYLIGRFVLGIIKIDFAAEQWTANRGIVTLELIVILLVIPLVIVAIELNGLIFALLSLGLVVSAISQRQEQPSATLPVKSTQTLEIEQVEQVFASTLELDELLVILTDQILDWVPVEGIFIALYTEPYEVASYQIIVVNGETYPIVNQSLRSGSLEQVVLATKQTLHIAGEQANDLKRLNLGAVLPSAYDAFLGVPFVHASQVIGIIGLLDSGRPDGFTAFEIANVERIAGRVGLAIENARLYRDSSQLVAHLSMINDSVQTLLFNLDSQDVIQTICQTAMTITSADRAAIFLLDRESNRMALAHEINLTDEHREHNREFYFALDTKPIVVRDITPSTASAPLNTMAKMGDFRAVAETFLVSGTVITGMLAVYHNRPYNYSPAELDLMGVLGNQVTVALENAELLHALELYASEMAQLVHLSRNSMASLQPEEVAFTAVDTLRQMFDVDSATIVVFQSIYDGNEVLVVLGNSPDDIAVPQRKSVNLFDEVQAIRDQTAPIRNVIQHNSDGVSRELRLLMHKK